MSVTLQDVDCSCWYKHMNEAIFEPESILTWNSLVLICIQGKAVFPQETLNKFYEVIAMLLFSWSFYL